MKGTENYGFSLHQDGSQQPHAMSHGHNHQPGNGSRYEFLLVDLPDGQSVFFWMNRGESKRRNAMMVPNVGCDHWYISDKLDKPLDGDLTAIRDWLGAQGVNVRRG